MNISRYNTDWAIVWETCCESMQFLHNYVILKPKFYVSLLLLKSTQNTGQL